MEIKGNINAGYGNIISASTKSSIVGGIGNVVVGNNNLIGGGSGNTVNTNFGVIVGGYGNQIPSGAAYQSSIVGGNNNQILNSNESFIGGGDSNELRQSSNNSFIGGGYNNRIGTTVTATDNAPVSVIVGGGNNYISSGGKGDETKHGFIGGGFNNYLLEGTFSFIGAGANNRITGTTNTIVAGAGNTIKGLRNFIGGGDTNIIESASDVVIGGGKNNYIGDGADHSIIIGGEYNYIKPIGLSGPFIQTHNLIGGGYGNRISLYSNLNPSDGKGNNIILNSKKATMYGYSYRNHNTILNTGWIFSTPISNYSSGIHGGSHNSILGGAASYLDRDNNPTTGLTHAIIGYSYLSTLVSGYGNMINDAIYSTIVNGYHNYIGGGNNLKSNFIGTGYANKISKSSDYSMIGVGDRNAMYYTQGSFISSGRFNTISGTSTGYGTQSRQSSILGGRDNLLRSSFSSIIGGRDNTINLSSTYSSILGGQNNIISHSRSHIIGSNITSISANTTHVEKLNIGTLNGTTPITNLALDANGFVVDGSSLSGGTFCTLITETISACTNHISFYPIGNVGVKTSNPTFDFEVNGTFGATSKSFDIPHPTKEGKRLRYGSLEGPEYGVYVRGKLSGENIIELPEHWAGLVDENSITVQLTPYGRKQDLFVGGVINNTVEVLGDESPECYYMVLGERKDIDRITVEY